MNKIIRILNVYNNKPNLRPLSTKIAEFKGKIQAQIETNKSQVGTKTNRNNNGNANRTTKKVTTGNDTKSANRVNRIRPFIMKMSHLTNNQKAYYINQAKTNNTKLLSEIVKNARLRAYRRT